MIKLDIVPEIHSNYLAYLEWGCSFDIPHLQAFFHELSFRKATQWSRYFIQKSKLFKIVLGFRF